MGIKDRTSSHGREKGGKEKGLHSREKNISGKKEGSNFKERSSSHNREKGVKDKSGKDKSKLPEKKNSTSSLNTSSHQAGNGKNAKNSPDNADASWTPPLWLTKEKHQPRARSMTIPIPPVPAATRKAIIKFLNKQQPPYYKQQAQAQQLQNKLKAQQEKVKNAQQKLDKLEETKAEKIMEIRVLSGEEIEASLKKIEEDATKEHEAQLKEKEEEWQQQTEKEMKAAKRQFKKDQAEMDEQERESHKQMFEEEQKKKAQQEIERKESIEDGEVDDTEESGDPDLTPSQRLEKKLKEATDHLEGLKETKKEMVWLLRQVITAEKKRKASESSIPKKKQKL